MQLLLSVEQDSRPIANSIEAMSVIYLVCGYLVESITAPDGYALNDYMVELPDDIVNAHSHNGYFDMTEDISRGRLTAQITG